MSKFKFGVILSSSLFLVTAIILLIYYSVVMTSALSSLGSYQTTEIQYVILLYSFVIALLGMEIVFYILPIVSAAREDPSIYLGVILLLFGGLIPGILYILWLVFEASSPEANKNKHAGEKHSIEIELTKKAKAEGKVVEKAMPSDINLIHK